MTADLPPQQTPRSLQGLRILDLSRILAAPTCTQLFGDLGAEIIKVERPGTGDDTRVWGPPFINDGAGEPTGLSAYFVCANRNKRSIAVDLASEAGAEVIRRLVAVSDVVIENYKPGDLARRGLGYDQLRQVKPDLIWCSVSGFGQTGPYAERIGYDFLVQAMGGIMSITGAPEEEGGEPMKVGVGVADIVCGLYAAVGILAALRHRDLTGEGQFIDLSLYDSQVAWLVNAATNYLVTGKRPRRLGNRHPNIVPYQTFRASDGHLVVAIGNDRQFARFADVMAHPEWTQDERFRSNPARVANHGALEALILEETRKRPVADWVERLVAAGVPAGPVAAIDEVLTNAHTLARGMVIEMPAPGLDAPLKLLGNPLKMSATPPVYERPPPRLDADREHVLRHVLGLAPDEIQDLEERGAFAPTEV